jgi:hypothetical protein
VEPVGGKYIGECLLAGEDNVSGYNEIEVGVVPYEAAAVKNPRKYAE